MIIWGTGAGGADLGQQSVQECPVCEKVRPFNLLLRYRYAHLYYLRWVTKRQYFLACEICQRGAELNVPETEKALGKDPVPFMTRNGWMFLLGAIVVAVLTFAALTGGR